MHSPLAAVCNAFERGRHLAVLLAAPRAGLFQRQAGYLTPIALTALGLVVHALPEPLAAVWRTLGRAALFEIENLTLSKESTPYH
jgi:hypothetical protein